MCTHDICDIIYVYCVCTCVQLCKEDTDGDSVIPLGRKDDVSFDTHEYDGNIYIEYGESDDNTGYIYRLPTYVPYLLG